MYGDDTVIAHQPGYTVHRTRNALFVTQLVPYPRAAVVTVIIPKYTPYFNKQIIVIDPVLAFRPVFKRVIPAPTILPLPGTSSQAENSSGLSL